MGRKVFDEIYTNKCQVWRKFEYLNGAATETHYDSKKLKSQPTTQLVSKITLSDGRTLEYEYDAEERITKVTDSIDGVVEYEYDALGQLISETRGNVKTGYAYDNYGNLLAKGNCDANGGIIVDTMTEYGYGGQGKDLLSTYGGEHIFYDAQGNPTNYRGRTLVWEKGRQLKSYAGNTYTYNANGIRTSRTFYGDKHDFILDGSKILRECWMYNNSTGKYDAVIETIYDNEDNVCGIIYNGTPYYFQKNLQGDVIAITNSSGTVVVRYTYDAWGKIIGTYDDTLDAISLLNPYRYRSYFYDHDTGLYYLQSRYYDPETGRFLNGDSAETVTMSGEILQHNMYAYCECDPINNIDSNGAISWARILSIFEKIGGFAKKILDYLIEGASSILGLKVYIKRSDISKIAKNVKRSPHRVRQNFDWLYSRIKNLKTKTGRIFRALVVVLFFTYIAGVIGKVKNTVSKIIKLVAEIIADGLSALFSWLVRKGVKLLSKFIPALGGVLGFLAGGLIGRAVDVFFNKKSAIIANKYAKKVNVYKFSMADYFTTFFIILQ